MVFADACVLLQFVPPGELLEGYTRTRDEPGNAFTDMLKGRQDPLMRGPNRIELNQEDPTPFQRQVGKLKILLSHFNRVVLLSTPMLWWLLLAGQVELVSSTLSVTGNQEISLSQNCCLITSLS